jgi:hypothetical protein
MRRHILSRANVVAFREATRLAKAPSRYVSIRTPFEPIEEKARCSMGSVRIKALLFEPRPPTESGGHTPRYQGIRSRLRTERRTLGLSIGRLSGLTYWS